jgi:Uma2 family endonuclease
MTQKEMKSAFRRTHAVQPTTVPALHNGDRLTQREFHRRYEACPKHIRFELIGGIVFMASPMRRKHSQYDDELGYVLGYYRRATQGVEAIHGATTILGEESEPQPDLGLLILEEYGGQIHTNEDDYINGAPELITEIAHSTVAIDMHLKKADYENAGVNEYLVLCVDEQQLHWFDFKSGGLIVPDKQGVFRSRVFPGLWIDGPALVARKSTRVLKQLKKGLASPEHAAFVKRLQTAHRKHRSS